ncbi:S-layer homology domain-containing protein [Baaleninema sp.]|uniref:S-layer homology domain-containing protein n=1 Tax=Baaleninema sp. TaxID=3101197 RepID=UPI003D07BDA0
MVNPTPPEPPSSRRVTRDEWMAIFIALGVMGGIGAWVANRGDRAWTIDRSPSQAIETATESLQTGALESQSDAEAETGLFSFDFAGESSEAPNGETEARVERETASAASLEPVDGEPSSTPVSDRRTVREAISEREDETDETARETEPAATASPTPATGETTEPAATASPTPATAPPPPARVDPNLPEAETPVNFTDVPEGYWAKPYIDAMSARNLVEGVEGNLFLPETAVTRAQFAALVEQVFEERNATRDPIDFNDISNQYWAVDAINEAVRLGFLKGYPGQKFQPDKPVTRFEVLLSLSSGLGFETPENPDAVLAAYADGDTVPQWAKTAVAAAANAGLLDAYPNQGQLDLDRSATRADVTAMTYRALVQAGEAEPLDSANP